jgi:hypothetical protein
MLLLHLHHCQIHQSLFVNLKFLYLKFHIISINRSKVVALLRSTETHEMALTRFIEMYEQR